MDIADVWHEMERRGSCMLIDKDGARLRGRPMSAVVRQEEGVVWFVTDQRDAKDDEIRRDPQVCLAFVDESDRFYLSLSGTADVIRDAAKLRELWSPAMKAYFDGPDDPNALLLKVIPAQAEIWQGEGMVSTTLKMAQAMFSDERPDLGENAKFRM